MRPIRALLALAFLPLLSYATTIHVPGDEPTISAGLGLAASGDTVLVACGSYGETYLNIPSGVVLRSEDGAECTILGDIGWGPIIETYNSGPGTVIDGFTFLDGVGDGTPGGVVLSNSQVEIRDCAFVDCVPGLSIDSGSTVDLISSTFYGCEGGGAPASGVQVIGNSTLAADNTIIAFGLYNQAVHVEAGSSAAFTCSDIFGNAGGDWTGAIAGQLGVDGNLSVDPVFCDAGAGDLSLEENSPLADAPGCGLMGAFDVGCAFIECSLDPDSLTFEYWVAGDPVEGTFTLTNDDPVHDLVGTLSWSGAEFDVMPTAYDLAPGASQEFTVTFTPADQVDDVVAIQTGALCGDLICISSYIAPFTDIEAGLQKVYDSGAAWGDYDGDGDLDLAITGNTGSAYFSDIYRNDAGTFVPLAAGISPDHRSALDWVDYDQDGDLDLFKSGPSTAAKLYRNDAGSFVEVDTGATLPAVSDPCPAWGDYDADGDLDLLHVGQSFCSLYRNDEGLFALDQSFYGFEYPSAEWADPDQDGDLDFFLVGSGYIVIYLNEDAEFTYQMITYYGFNSSSADWGDYDADGDLDILVVDGIYSRIWRNDGDGWAYIDNMLPKLYYSDASWGDFDSDGDLDVLVAGWTGSVYTTQILRNEAGVFEDIEAGLPPLHRGAMDWGDYDGDGDLDILATGSNGTSQAYILRNDTFTTNTPPTAPNVLAQDFADGMFLLEWTSASDLETPVLGLSYNLRVGTTPGGSEIRPPMSLPSGRRLIPERGQADQNTSWPLELAFGENYYWSVQCVDGGFEGSPFSEERVISTSGTLVSIEDVTGDQGRNLRLTWERSPWDAPDDGIDVTGYEVHRRQDGRAAGWDFLTWVPAHGDSIYDYVAPTLCDSTAEEGICWSVFMVRATTPDPFVFVDSPPDSGYSIDNLAPSVPSGFLLAYGGTGGNSLSWDECPDEDFDFFNVYRDTDPEFEPSEESRVHQTTGTTWEDASGTPAHFYKVAAVDFAGNESDPASPDEITDGPEGALPASFALHQNNPNPFNPATSIRFDLPRAGDVRLEIFDVSGRRIAILAEGRREAGRHEVLWRGGDERGRPASSGVYFYKLTAPGYSETKRMLLLK